VEIRQLLTNEIHYLKKEEVAKIIGPDPDRFKEIMDLAFSRDMPICWRATWIMDYLAEIHPWLAEAWIGKLWQEVPKNHPVGVTRSLIRLLSRYDIPEDEMGPATDLCLEWITREAVPVAIKVFSMELLLKIATAYPELSNEFISIIEDHAENNSAGYKARSQYIIKNLQKLIA